MNYSLIILVVIVLALIGYVVGIYNKYVSLDEENATAFSNIGSFLQKRLDLIPNLVETVKAYAKHESETFEKVVAARNQMINIDYKNAENIAKIQEAENNLKSALRSIFALNENYPELKANENFLGLQETLENIENELVAARKYYNYTARILNVFTRSFPNVLFKGIFHFRKAEMFKEDSEAVKVPKVNF